MFKVIFVILFIWTLSTCMTYLIGLVLGILMKRPKRIDRVGDLFDVIWMFPSRFFLWLMNLNLRHED